MCIPCPLGMSMQSDLYIENNTYMSANIATCIACHQEYYEPIQGLKRRYCGHCCLIRQAAQDGSEESIKAAKEYAEEQRRKAIQTRPRVNETTP